MPVGVVLVGKGTAHLPHFIYTFEETGRQGLGRERVPFTLESVEEAAGGRIVFRRPQRCLLDPGPSPEAAALQAEAPPGTAALLETLTSVRLRRDGALLESPDFPAFFQAVVRRLRALSYFHCGGESNLSDPERIFAAGGALRAVWEGAAWREQRRWSTRQHAFTPLGGFTGRLRLKGDLTLVWPFLRLAERVHVGKASSFGLGRFRLTPADGD